MASLNLNMNHIFCSVLLLAYINVSWCRTTNLFGASPDGGLWGVSLDTSSPEMADELQNAGYPGFNKQLSSVSYDHSSKKVLMEVQNPPSLYFGPLCSSNSDLPQMLTHVGPAPISDETLGDCVSCKASAFTLFDSKIYFLVVGEFFESIHMTYTRIAHVREMQSCDECADMSRKSSSEWEFVDTVKCSKLIVEVYKQSYSSATVNNNELKGGKQMKIEDYSGVKNFFFHIAEIIRPDEGKSRVNVSMCHANENGETKFLNWEEIDDSFVDWQMSTLGSLDLKDRLLCWSTGTAIYCGTYDNQTLSARRLVLAPAQGYTSGACTGDSQAAFKVGGVYIVKASATRHVVFGCYPDQPGAGGAGYIRFERDSNKVEITPIKTNDDDNKRAGSLFVTNSVARRCSFDPAPPICLGPPPPTTQEPEEEPEPEDGGAEGEPGKNEYGVNNEQSDDSDVEIVVDPDKPEVQKPAEVHGDGGANSLICSLTALILPLILCLLS